MSELETTGSNLPDLYRPQVSADLDGNDIVKPKLKIGQYMSAQVQDGLVKAGSLYTHLTEDDAEVVVEAGPEGVQDKGLEFYVLGVRKGWSWSEQGSELQTWADNDPTRRDDAWRTYTYTVALPTVDADLPYSFLLTRTSIGAARQLNLLLRKYEAAGQPGHACAFVLKTKKRENAKGKFFVAQVSTAPAPSNAKEREARETNQRIAASLAEMVQPSVAPAAVAQATDEPSI